MYVCNSARVCVSVCVSKSKQEKREIDREKDGGIETDQD